MPPKRARRPGGGTSSAVGSPLRFSQLSANKGPVLPNIPAKQSYAYGSSTTPILPRKLEARPKMDLVEMAHTIDDAVQNAKDREEFETMGSPHMNTRSRSRGRMTSLSQSPVRRPRREPTPDQIQLLDSLREVSASPRRPQTRYSNDTRQSTATPTPPIPHTFSTTSSPRQPVQGLYPSPLQQLGSPARDDNLLGSSPISRLSLDNESVISWGVEREIHDDNLQRTRSDRYREDPQGKHINAPPRRFSGLAFAHDTIEEEEEPQSAILGSKSPSHVPPTAAKSTPESEGRPELSSAPTRTIISDRLMQKSPSQGSSIHEAQPLQTQLRNDSVPQQRKSRDDLWTLILRIATLVLLTSTSMLTIYTFVGKFADSGYGSIFDGKIPNIALNDSGLEALNSLSHQMVKIGAQVSSLSSEVKVMKTEVKNVAAPTTVLEPYVPRQEIPKTNFLSLGLGVIIDPYITSPVAEPARTWLQSMYLKFSRGKHRLPQPPLAALTPWEDMGECWCSVPRQGMSQLGILLGRRIVPEEVVVEHMAKGATIRPEVAPKQMELWARYRYMANSTSSSRSYISQLLLPSRENPSGQDSIAPDRVLLHGPIMDTLRQAYENEPESAYSGDQLLGPYFYRIGRWTYDINGVNNIQKFSLDAIIDSPEMRVDKVVFRVNSNWGGNNTCIYRLKLHGHM